MLKTALVISLTFISFQVKNKPTCYKNLLTNHKLGYVGLNVNSDNSFFYFTDSSKIETINGKIFSESKMQWKSCSEFVLTIKRIADNPTFKIGDELKGRILGVNSDTVLYILNVKGKETHFRAIL